MSADRTGVLAVLGLLAVLLYGAVLSLLPPVPGEGWSLAAGFVVGVGVSVAGVLWQKRRP